MPSVHRLALSQECRVRSGLSVASLQRQSVINPGRSIFFVTRAIVAALLRLSGAALKLQFVEVRNVNNNSLNCFVIFPFSNHVTGW